MALSIAAMCCFFQNENKSISRGENHYQWIHVEAFMYSPGVLKGKVRQRYFSYSFNLKTIILNITYIIGEANSQINSQNNPFSIKSLSGIGFPLVNLRWKNRISVATETWRHPLQISTLLTGRRPQPLRLLARTWCTSLWRCRFAARHPGGRRTPPWGGFYRAPPDQCRVVGLLKAVYCRGWV